MKIPIKISSRKAKGRNLQNQICQLISDTFGISWDKDDDSSLISSRPMGQSGVDIILRGEAREKVPLSIECKAQESFSIHSWIKQAKENQQDGTDWAIIAKRNREDAVAIIDAKLLFKLLKK